MAHSPDAEYLKALAVQMEKVASGRDIALRLISIAEKVQDTDDEFAEELGLVIERIASITPIDLEPKPKDDHPEDGLA